MFGQQSDAKAAPLSASRLPAFVINFQTGLGSEFEEKGAFEKHDLLTLGSPATFEPGGANHAALRTARTSRHLWCLI